MRSKALILFLIATASCGRLEDVGRAPAFGRAETSDEFRAMAGAAMPLGRGAEGSLWSRERGSLLGDRRA
ncbi:MAG: flagellar basal body L-ring protein, partial [Rhodobacteraceae bacterium]|nr:flagellar basal body L-ring protein [Paracoccaceae bacterium]MCB2139674.1 flagellar basal body L-ring protein [Paracoccaceae bacterium]MCB2149783.1 flagellar basal body L-ring protein [Paracoccaceae bacterium]